MEFVFWIRVSVQTVPHNLGLCFQEFDRQHEFDFVGEGTTTQRQY
jgi:hypothetical protein